MYKKLIGFILLMMLLGACNKTSNDYLKYYERPQQSRKAPTSISPDRRVNTTKDAGAPTVLTWEMVINSSYWKYLDQLQVEYVERMQSNTKKYKKIAKEMEKPQYSDPLYFGHKKKPKKRPLGKRKYCDECGLWH